MQKMKWITVLVVWLAAGNLLAQAGQQVVDTKDAAPLDAQREKRALQIPVENRAEANHTCGGCHARRQVRVCAD